MRNVIRKDIALRNAPHVNAARNAAVKIKEKRKTAENFFGKKINRFKKEDTMIVL